jgi:hypothetical protein
MGWLPDPVARVGIQVADTGYGVGLSEAVEAALPLAVEAARRELRDLDGITTSRARDGSGSDAADEATA